MIAGLSFDWGSLVSALVGAIVGWIAKAFHVNTQG